MTNTKPRPCQATNPATCRYHGKPETLIQNAARKGNIQQLRKLRIEIYRNYLKENPEAAELVAESEKVGIIDDWNIERDHHYPIREPEFVNLASQYPAQQGERYESHKTFTPVELSKLVRYDLKEAIINKYIPAELNYSVSTRNDEISIIVSNTLPEESERVAELEARLKNILNNYTYKSLNPDTAYLGSTFGTSVRIASEEEQNLLIAR